MSKLFTKGQRVVCFNATTTDSKTQVVCWVKEFTVASWGAKQGTLLRNDGTNAEFRVYTQNEKRPDLGRDTVLFGSVDIDAYAREMKIAVVEHEAEFIAKHRIGNFCYNQQLMRDQIDALKALRATL